MTEKKADIFDLNIVVQSNRQTDLLPNLMTKLHIKPPIQILKISNEKQASHIFFFTLLFMFGIYEPTCIEIPALSF